MIFRALLVCALLTGSMLAQSVQPVIVEYKGKAEGKMAITNNSGQPMVVVLEPKSFSITPEGRGMFRPLDSGIHVELSAMSVKLQPKQTYYVFYKASAETLPAWFTVYATFVTARHSAGLDVRIMLPHTVYLYQKQPLPEENVEVKDVLYSARLRKVICNLENTGAGLARVQEVRVTGGKESSDVAGFPFLPGASRRIEIDWKEEAPPKEIALRLEHFTVKRPVQVGDEY